MKALYRKYRPTKLSEVISQSQVTTPLSNAIKSGKISHSYLFTGPRGCGKTSVARIFAHEVNDFKYEIEDSYVDIVEIDAASNTGVDNIRELREKAAIAPSQGKYKVYIIDEVHMLSKSAFNALLKTLEEPPKHVIFIMATTDAYKVPITITSRAQVFNFQLAAPDIMLKHLQSIAKKENIAIKDEALEIIVRRGGGSFRDSLSLLDQISALGASGQEITAKIVTDALGLPEAQIIEDLLKCYCTGDFESTTNTLKNCLNSGINAEVLAENLISYIIEHPNPKLFTLLERLPEVKNPFPEAKLLLAFTENIVKATKIAAKPVNAPTPVVTAPKAKEPEKEPEKPLESPKSPVVSGKFNWESLLDSVKDSNFAIYSTLSKCHHEISNNQITIIAERKIHKTILKSESNYRFIQKFIPEGYSLKIIDSSEKTQNSSKYNQISDIMGSVTEVGSDGVPF